jgi:phosphoglycolate phosphatase-like HAD superfamily hydrolase
MSDDRLPSWRDGAPKSALLSFIDGVTTRGPSWVQPEQRIATFDIDGTLWCEKPMYIQADFIFRRLREMAAADPTKADEQPWKAIVENDRAWLADLLHHIPELLKAVGQAYSGITTDAFADEVRDFFATVRHPTLGVPYTAVSYAPMRELIQLLEASVFEVYVCTGGGRDFVRVVSEEALGLPSQRIIGSASTLEYRDGDVYRTEGVEMPIDDGPGKPVHIWARVGRKPLLAGGNSDGDIAMLESAAMGVLIHHDDAEREFAYDDGAELALKEADVRGWTVVSMRDDFANVF